MKSECSLSQLLRAARRKRRKGGGRLVAVRLSALVHNDKECRVEAQMEPVAVFDFHRGIDFAGLSLVAGRLNHNIAVARARFEHCAVGRPKALGVPVPALEPNAEMLARCVGAHIGDAGRGFGQRTNHGAARIACRRSCRHVS